MIIFVTNIAFERQLFIVYFLQISPIIQFKLDGLWEAFFQINLHRDPSAGLETLLWLRLNILSQRVSNGPKGFFIPPVKWQEREANPNWHYWRNVIFWVKVWSPSVQIDPMSPHEVGAIPENKVPIFLLLKEEDKETPVAKGMRHTIFQLRLPVLVDPNCNRFRRGLDLDELADQAMLHKLQGKRLRTCLNQDLWNFFQLLHKAWLSLL